MVSYPQIRKAQELEGKSQFKEAAQVVRESTLNIQWYKSLILKDLNKSHGATPEAIAKTAETLAEGWDAIVTKELNERLHDVRARHFTAVGDGNFSRMAETAFEEGHLYCLHGNYRQALLLYRQARSADPSNEVRSVYHATQTHMIQKDWSMVVSSLFNYTNDFAKGGVWNALASCYALASWCLGDFCNCFNTLMTLTMNQQSAQSQQENDKEEMSMQWLSQDGNDTLLVLTGMATLSYEDLVLASNSDTNLSHALDRNKALKSLVKAFLCLEIPSFWENWDRAMIKVQHQWQIDSSIVPVETILAFIMYGRFLAIRSQARASQILMLFNYQTLYTKRIFDYDDLKVIANGMDLSLEIDLVDDLLTLKPKQHDIIVDLEHYNITQCAKTAFKLWSNTRYG